MNTLLEQDAATPPVDSTSPIGTIYLAYNTVTGKGYVGQTRQPFSRRQAAHFTDVRQAGRAFHRALAKYGALAFEWYILAETTDLTQLDSLERIWIAALATHSSMGGYNMTFGGDGINTGRGQLSHNWGRKRPDTAQRNRKQNPMTIPGVREKMIRSLTGRKGKPTTKGRKLSDQHRGRISEALRAAYREGRKQSMLTHTSEQQSERLRKAYRAGTRRSMLVHTPDLQRARAMKRWHPEG